jgi:hypothetical protein
VPCVSSTGASKAGANGGHARKLIKLILDMDSPVSETYGHQEGSA